MTGDEPILIEPGMVSFPKGLPLASPTSKGVNLPSILTGEMVPLGPIALKQTSNNTELSGRVTPPFVNQETTILPGMSVFKEFSSKPGIVEFFKVS